MCGGGVAPPTQGSGSRHCVVTDIIVMLCCVSGKVCGLPVVSQVFGILEEQDVVVLGVPPFWLASGHWSEHFLLHPCIATDTIKWAWLNTLYLRVV